MLFEWIIIAAVGYFLMAVSGVADKFLVSKVVREPIAYAFYTALTGPASLALILIGNKTLGHFQFLNTHDTVAALLCGIFFIVGIYFSWSAILNSSVSKVVPIQGGLGSLFTFLFAFLILNERLTASQTIGFGYLVFGVIIISLHKEQGKWTWKGFSYAALSSACFALFLVLTKYTFNNSNYISGMVWTRLGFVFPLPFILAFKKNREAIFNAPKEAGVRNVALYYTSRASGTIGSFLQNYAISLGSVSIVNALQGMQFAFLLILTSFFSIYYPKVLKEDMDHETITLKVAAIAVISCGLFLLFK